MRFGLPFSVCMFDIDKFKLYNDTFGHPAGDQVIAAVAKTACSFPALDQTTRLRPSRLAS